MDMELLKKFEASLLDEKKKLTDELSHFTKQNPRNPEDFNTDFPNLGDKEDENASEVAEFSTNLTLERTLEGQLRDIEKALARVADNTYGTCKYCGKEIGEKRLMARPTSTSCIECKKLFTE
jgi:RNA polymerase-binding protein DksA